MQDLGIWAYRMINRGGPGAITRGSAVDFFKALQGQASSVEDTSAPGVVIANPGQLLWWRGGKRAVSFVSWHSLPRKSAVHGPMRIDDVKNRVPGNESLENHVRYVFDEVMAKMTNEDAQIDVIGLSDGGSMAMKFLNDNCEFILDSDHHLTATDRQLSGATWSSRIAAIALGNPLHTINEISNASFARFLRAVPPLNPIQSNPIPKPFR